MTHLTARRPLAMGVLVTIVLALIAAHLYGKFAQISELKDYILPFILPFLGLLYAVKIRDRNFYFLMFVILYTLGELSLIWIDISPNLIFFIGNSLFTLAYIFLVIDTFERLRNKKGLKALLKTYKIHILLLLIVSSGLMTLLSSHLDMYHDMPEMLISTVLYLLMVTLLLSLTIINMFENYGKRAITFFLASFCIVLMEVVQITYYYNLSFKLLYFTYSLLQILGFFLFYQQAVFDSKAKNLTK